MTIFAITLGFGPARVVERSLRTMYATKNKDLSYRHVLLDQHYPLNKEANREAIRGLCRELGIDVLDAGKNLGLHHGFNWALAQLAPKPEDIVIAYDPDSKPLGYGWDMALVRAIAGDDSGKVVWSSLMNPRSRRDLEARGYTPRLVDGYLDLWVTKSPVTNSICAWRCGWLKEVGGLKEPNDWYGHLEAMMWGVLKDRQWAFLPQWEESDEFREDQDRKYVVYKWVFAHLKAWPGDFESWLDAGCPNPEDGATPQTIP